MKDLHELIQKLTEIPAPSGREHPLQNLLLELVKDVADEVRIDVLGNAIARKNGEGPLVMLAAHSDEPGIMVTHVDDKGFLRFHSVGGVDAHALIGRSVRFTNDVRGTVGCAHNVKVQDVTFDDLYLDIGAESEESARQLVREGDEAVIEEPLVKIGEHRLFGRALDNRVGSAIAIHAFRELASLGSNVAVVFTVQNAVGARGAKTASYQLQPDLALVIDAAPAGDMPDAERMELSLGKGPAVKILDASAIIPLDVKDLLIDSATKAGVPVQYEVWPRGRTDAGAVQLSVDGIRVGGVSYPARYEGKPGVLIDLRDAENAVKLIVEAVKNVR